MIKITGADLDRLIATNPNLLYSFTMALTTTLATHVRGFVKLGLKRFSKKRFYVTFQFPPPSF